MVHDVSVPLPPISNGNILPSLNHWFLAWSVLAKDNIEIDVTIDDPKAYGKPFTYTLRQTLIPDQDLFEYFCTENEKDVEHFK